MGTRIRRERRAELALQPGEETWGVWAIPESDVGLLPDRS